MTGREFKDLVNSVTYKQGWRIAANADWGRGNMIHVALLHTEPDAANPSKTTEIMNRQYINAFDIERWHKADAFEWLRMMFMAAEEHEFCEFFRVDGVAPFPAHPEARL